MPPSPDRSPARAPRSGFPLALLACLLVVATAFLGGRAPSGEANAWYASLTKAPFTPPGAVFPIAWGLLYTAMAVSAVLVVRHGAATGTSLRTVGTLFVAQLGLNAAWSWLFFGFHLPRIALVDLVALLVLVLATIRAMFRHVPAAAWLLVPYAVWLGFAGVLNAWIVAANGAA
jgi:benzodiazapine receptor